MRSEMAESNLKEKIGTIRALVQLSLPYKKRFILIALLAFLGTGADLLQPLIDRKSTRLNSSHQIISYAVFCLKKKKQGTLPRPAIRASARTHSNPPPLA